MKNEEINATKDTPQTGRLFVSMLFAGAAIALSLMLFLMYQMYGILINEMAFSKGLVIALFSLAACLSPFFASIVKSAVDSNDNPFSYGPTASETIFFVLKALLSIVGGIIVGAGCYAQGVNEILSISIGIAVMIIISHVLLK